MEKSPRIKFRAPWIYNEYWKEWVKLYPLLESRVASPSFDEVWKRKEVLEVEWGKVENQVLAKISELTHLEWKSNEIICYVTGNSLAFSEPLTIPVSVKNDRFIDILTHELFHVLFVAEEGNYQRLSEYWSFINDKYKDEPFNTRIHLSVHAFHKALILELFDKSKWEREKEIVSVFPEYKRSIEIVEQEGHENIIKEFVDRIK